MKNSCLTILLFFLLQYAVADDFERIVFPEAEVLSDNTIRLPFKLADHLIMVKAEVYNQKGYFIIDSGSEALILNKAHYPKQLALKEKKLSSFGVLKQVGDVYQNSIDEITLKKNFSIANKFADIIDLSPLEKQKKAHILGIIGYDILKDYEVFIDFYLTQITLSKIDRFGNRIDKKNYLERIIDTLNFELIKHTIVLSGFVNGKKLKLALDTAAEINQLSIKTHHKVLQNYTPVRRLKINDVGNRKEEVMVGVLSRMKYNNHLFSGPMTTMLTELTAVNKAFGTKLDGIIGYEFLKTKRTIINYKKHKLYFINFPIVSK